MISWALMTNSSTLERSKTLEKTQDLNFSSLASALTYAGQEELDFCLCSAEVGMRTPDVLLSCRMATSFSDPLRG
jgi:hypothetical protein